MSAKVTKKGTGKGREIRLSAFRRVDPGVDVRGKYFNPFQKGASIVLLAPDVAKAFPTAEAVNDALRSLMNVARKPTQRKAKLAAKAAKSRRR
jgi:hypothetical protein